MFACECVYSYGTVFIGAEPWHPRPRLSLRASGSEAKAKLGRLVSLVVISGNSFGDWIPSQKWAE